MQKIEISVFIFNQDIAIFTKWNQTSMLMRLFEYKVFFLLADTFLWLFHCVYGI